MSAVQSLAIVVMSGKMITFPTLRELRRAKGETGLIDGLHTFQVKAKDAVRNEDQSPAECSFTVDSKRPAVESVMPAENAMGISASTDVNAVFSEAMRAESVNANVVKLYERGSSVPLAARVTYEAATNRAILNPDTEFVVEATNVRCGSQR